MKATVSSEKKEQTEELEVPGTHEVPPPATWPPARSEGLKATTGAVGLTLTWALPPAPALQPLMLPCPDRCSTLDADPRAVAGLGAFCDRWSNPHCPSFSSVLLTPGHQAGWKGFMSSHSPLACAFPYVPRIIRVSTSLSRPESNPSPPYCRWILYQLNYQGNPI